MEYTKKLMKNKLEKKITVGLELNNIWPVKNTQ